MNQTDYDFSHAVDIFQDAIDEMQDRISSGIIAEQIYKGKLEDCIFETRDILRKMQEDSDKESKINQRRFVIQTVLTVASLVTALVAAVAAVIALL